MNRYLARHWGKVIAKVVSIVILIVVKQKVIILISSQYGGGGWTAVSHTLVCLPRRDLVFSLIPAREFTYLLFKERGGAGKERTAKLRSI